MREQDGSPRQGERLKRGSTPAEFFRYLSGTDTPIHEKIPLPETEKAEQEGREQDASRRARSRSRSLSPGQVNQGEAEDEVKEEEAEEEVFIDGDDGSGKCFQRFVKDNERKIGTRCRDLHLSMSDVGSRGFIHWNTWDPCVKVKTCQNYFGRMGT